MTKKRYDTNFQRIQYTVLDHNFKVLGYVDTMHEAKELHKQHLPEPWLSAYAGLDCSSNNLGESGGYIAKPSFYTEFCTPEMINQMEGA